MRIYPVKDNKAEICRAVLCALPEWFGIPEAIEQYVSEVELLPLVAAEVDERIVGIVSLKRHTEFAAEVHVLGVLPTHHRQGVGRALLERVAAMARGDALWFLTVKTLSPARENRAYEKTRAFYRALGFIPIEEFPSLWGPANPALLLAKCLRHEGGEHADPDEGLFQ